MSVVCHKRTHALQQSRPVISTHCEKDARSTEGTEKLHYRERHDQDAHGGHQPPAGTRLTSHPPNGAASTPPSTSGINCSSGTAPISVKNVVAAEAVTKNSAVLTEPTA